MHVIKEQRRSCEVGKPDEYYVKEESLIKKLATVKPLISFNIITNSIRILLKITVFFTFKIAQNNGEKYNFQIIGDNVKKSGDEFDTP